jgi:hypothetical protein
MRVLFAIPIAVLAVGCSASDPDAMFVSNDITAYVAGPWRSLKSTYISGGLDSSCIMSTISVNSLPVRPFFRSSWPQALVTTDTRKGEKDRIVFHLAVEQDPKSQPVVIVDGKEFKLAPNGEYAEAADARTQLALLNAMKNGSSSPSIRATVRGVAKDGTRTEDNFGLQGFEAQLSSMDGYCRREREKKSS